MTHAELIILAAKWVRKTKRCPVVLADVRCTVINEQPDVISWTNNGFSSVVECKASRADFLRDAKKWFRRSPEQGMGYERWYCAPYEMLKVTDLPPGWGLIEPALRWGVRTVRPSEKFHDRNERGERALLVSALRRATEGWGRGIFGEGAPPITDGDPHPSAARVIRDLRLDNQRLREQLAAQTRVA